MGIFRRAPKLKNYRMPDGQFPVCPHCDHEVDGLAAVTIGGQFGEAQSWCCPHCFRILGIGHHADDVAT